jgi:RNA polymerase-binding transcription factor DksA
MGFNYPVSKISQIMEEYTHKQNEAEWLLETDQLNIDIKQLKEGGYNLCKICKVEIERRTLWLKSEKSLFN